jgi:glycosyltransferase involved in cell wall biosynthesis
MHLVHLTASTFFGGPERQLLGLGRALPGQFRSTYLSFSESGRSGAFLERAADAGFETMRLEHDTPHLRAAIRELTAFLYERNADCLLAHGYKANLLGRIAARRCGIPVVAVSRGWTGENFKVRCYETLDRFHLRFMDAVVCVSQGQAWKVRRAGVSARKVQVIRNAARVEAFRDPDPAYRDRLRQLAGLSGSGRVVLAAGRLSPEKGFHVLVEAAGLIARSNRSIYCVLFGEGAERPLLERRIDELGLRDRFVLAGFREDLDRWLPWADLVVLPSFTEGLPNVALEAAAAGVPVVATAVGGTPEVVCDGLNGMLVSPGDPSALAESIIRMCDDDALSRTMGNAGRRLMHERFSFAAQAQAYQRLFAGLTMKRRQALRGAA